MQIKFKRSLFIIKRRKIEREEMNEEAKEWTNKKMKESIAKMYEEIVREGMKITKEMNEWMIGGKEEDTNGKMNVEMN